MQLQNFYAQDANGNIIPSATCSLYFPGTTTLATGLQDASGNPLSNPFTAAENGLVAVSAPQGYYDLEMLSGARTGKIRVQFIDTAQVASDAAAAQSSASSASSSAQSAQQAKTDTQGLYNNLTSTNGATLVKTSDGSNVQTSLNGKQGSSVNLTALSGLSGAANQLPYFTAAGSMTLAALTSQARTFIAAATTAAQRTALQLGTAAVLNTRAMISEIINRVTYDDGYVFGYTTTGSSAQGDGNAFNYHQFNIDSDAVVQRSGTNGATGSKVNGINLLMKITGGEGGRHGIQSKILQTGQTASTNQDRFYSPMQGQILTFTGDGGTGPTDTRGAYFGMSAYAGMYNTADWIANLTAGEFNTDIAANKNIAIHTGVQVASLIGSRGYGLDACFSGACLATSAFGWKYGVAFHGLNGGPAFGSDSTVLKVFPGASANATIDKVIDVAGLTMNSIISSNNVTLSDSALTINRASAAVILGSSAAASTPALQMRSSGTASAFDVRLVSTGGSATAGSGVAQIDAGGVILGGTVTRGASDNGPSLGLTNFRWSVVYAGTGTINTSDAREKTSVSPMSEDEISASKQLAKEIGTYKWLAAIQDKGADARTHIGMTVQRAIEIMEENNLEPMEYGFICYDKWDATEAVIIDHEDGSTEVIQPATEAGDRYGFRMDELLAFIAAGFEARLSALEGK